MYQTKWLVGLSVIIFLAGMIDIVNIVYQLISVHRSEIILQKKITENSDVPAQHSVDHIALLHDEKIITEKLANAIQESGVMLRSIKITKDLRNIDNNMIVDALLTGEFNNAMHFFQSLAKNHLVWSIDRAVLLDDHRQVNLLLKLIVFGFSSEEATQKSSLFIQHTWVDPFVMDDQVSNRKSISFNSFSIQQMRLVGYVLRDKQLSGIVMLPNGDSLFVHTGDVLGKEFASVIEINKQAIVLRKLNHVIQIKNHFDVFIASRIKK
ncbi:MAG: hypothetical protein ACD_45C00751G0004 [uncultured bacterium]|nr:MAG: hypothetical protein ACD_45C00751G0004 [uncultured bacterium]